MSESEMLAPLYRLLRDYAALRDGFHDGVAIRSGPKKGEIPDAEDRLLLQQMSEIRDGATACLARLERALQQRPSFAKASERDT